jgi:hypothetical protein
LATISNPHKPNPTPALHPRPRSALQQRRAKRGLEKRGEKIRKKGKRERAGHGNEKKI